MEPWILTVAGLIAFGLGGYLLAALVRPEWFA